MKKLAELLLFVTYAAMFTLVITLGLKLAEYERHPHITVVDQLITDIKGGGK